MNPQSSLEQIDRDSVFHCFTDLRGHASNAIGTPRIMEGGEGVYVFDREGNRYLDAFAGLFCVNVGYGRQEIADAIHAQASKLAYYHTYAGHSNEPTIRLSERVLEMAPAGMSRVFYGLGGSDANDMQVKIAWYYNNVLGRPEKKKIISRLRGYHGGTVMSASLTGLPVYHQTFDLPLGPVLHTVTPHRYWHDDRQMSELEFSRWCATQLEDMILAEGPDTVAAFIAEPMMGTGGAIPPPEGYWDAVQAVLAKYDVLLIADEVVCGFGRLGEHFGSIYYGMKPDLMTVAKGITSAYLPLSGVIVGERVWQVLKEGSEKFGVFGHGYTYSAHPVSAAAAMANLDIYEREDIAGQARESAPYFLSSLREAFEDDPLVGEVRGAGLLAALEFVADRAERQRFDSASKVGPRIAARCLQHGLIARAMPNGDILGFSPPLIISRSEIDNVVDRARQAVSEIAAELAAEGAWSP